MEEPEHSLRHEIVDTCSAFNNTIPRSQGAVEAFISSLDYSDVNLALVGHRVPSINDTQGNADVHQELLRSKTSAHRQRRSQSQKELQIPLRVFSPSTELPTMSFNGTTYTSLLLFTKLAVGQSHSVSQLVMVASSKGTRASSFDIDSLSTFTVNILQYCQYVYDSPASLCQSQEFRCSLK